ncbi:hypothetical protein [Croceivirga sp. JEA036]|uniref:hypothetical protein n=1 Tax=Croceivirga sp. JEA036 TaxID=2721162 RepID=UPI00143AEE28|nr:hypothetical protein [Croceivirga sp. JEA036]NJB36658.1 hypothetical protein [Croceivirga sp. JEA036]
MNVTEFIQLLQEPKATLTPQQTKELEGMLEEYPYFQAARALHLKGLKSLESYKYNNALKVTAAHTTDREVLFDYITSEDFSNHQIANTILGRTAPLAEQETISEVITPNPDAKSMLEETEEAPLPQNITDAEQILDPALFNVKAATELTLKEGALEEKTVVERELGIGKPFQFTKSEKHSFTEWLQLTSTHQPIARDNEDIKETPISKVSKVKDYPLASKAETVKTNTQKGLNKKKKFELLDKFISTNPKIVPNAELMKKVDISDTQKVDASQLMTETLAKVYLEQKKYKKAIQAYKILSLKYPEKSGFFADQIRAVKQLQKEKN